MDYQACNVELWTGRQEARVLAVALSKTSCTALDKSFNLFGSQFSHL